MDTLNCASHRITDVIFYSITSSGSAASAGTIINIITESVDTPLRYEVIDEHTNETLLLEAHQVLGNPRLDIVK